MFCRTSMYPSLYIPTYWENLNLYEITGRNPTAFSYWDTSDSNCKMEKIESVGNGFDISVINSKANQTKFEVWLSCDS